jgi:DNA-directed RNA polymerase subunit L
MDPLVNNTSEENNVLRFTLSGVYTSLANSLRRIAIAEIPTVVFRTFPYSESKVTITKNTSRLNNEIIKQRIGCIPIHINDPEFPIQDYVVEVSKKNNTDTIDYLTTEDFKIKNVNTGDYENDMIVKKLFPADPITGDYIIITRLRPKLSDNMEGEEISFEAKLDYGMAKEDGMYNVVSTCSYAFTMDTAKANDLWDSKEKELKKEGYDENVIALKKRDYYAIDAKRIKIENSYDFVIESVGVYSNFEIVFKSCDIMIGKLDKVVKDVKEGNLKIEKNDNTTIDNEYKIYFDNEDYTLGYVLVSYLYDKYYEGDGTISYISFLKEHPHNNVNYLRMAFRSMNDETTIHDYLMNACTDLKKVYKEIQSKFVN